VPSPLGIASLIQVPLPDLRGEHRTEPVPPEAHSFVADIDAALEKKIFDLPQRERITDVHHHCEANYLGRTVEITEGVLHCWKLGNLARRLKSIYSDTAKAAV
jgi:hypothetical protein